MSDVSPMLETTDAVIDALGGNGPTGELVGATAKAVSTWRAYARCQFPAETFVALNQALQDVGLRADPALWKMLPARNPTPSAAAGRAA